MASLVLTGDTSGQVTIAAPVVAGTTTVTLPATTGTVLNDATCGVCRAWVNFNGTGTVAIRASFNVTSITDNGTGDYTVNFTNAMTDANYVVTGSAGNGDTGSLRVISTAQAATPTATATRLLTSNLAATAVDPTYVSVAIFR